MRPPADIQPLEGAATKTRAIARAFCFSEQRFFKAKLTSGLYNSPSVRESPTPPYAHVASTLHHVPPTHIHHQRPLVEAAAEECLGPPLSSNPSSRLLHRYTH